MEKIFEVLKNLFQDIINIVTGRGEDSDVAAQVLGAIKDIFGSASKDAE